MTDLDTLPDQAEEATRTRRRWLLRAVAGAATIGGVGLGWRNWRPNVLSQDVEAQFWAMALAGTDGRMLGMASLRGRPLVLNFWATWCPPCVEELPLLSRFYQENALKGWQVIGLAVDQLEAVQRFLVPSPVTFPVVMAGMAGIEISRSLGNLSGGLPFTVVFGPDGVVAHRKMGRVTPADLDQWMALT